MAKTALSNRERRALKKATPKPPRVAKGGGGERAAGRAADREEPANRDGLVWLGQKRRLTPEQMREAFRYRDLFRDAGEVALRSALDIGTGGCGVGGASPSPLVSLASARRELIVLRMLVLRGEDDMLTAMDGVCGGGHTLRGLAGGNQQRARDLEVLLKAALNLILAYRREPTAISA